MHTKSHCQNCNPTPPKHKKSQLKHPMTKMMSQTLTNWLEQTKQINNATKSDSECPLFIRNT